MQLRSFRVALYLTRCRCIGVPGMSATSRSFVLFLRSPMLCE